MEKDLGNKAPVNKIIPFSSVDGPGNRTSVFLQGCNFNCRYCHNPETRALCTDCGECVKTCPSGALTLREGKVLFDYKKCTGCDTCIRSCRFNASPRIRWMPAAEVYAEVRKQVPYIRGITVSGGECTLYPEFLTELADAAGKDGLTTLLDSNGTLDFRSYPELLTRIQGVMLDIKAWNPAEHRKTTDMDNAAVLQNMRYLAGCGKLTEVRTVVVPGLFNAEETVRETARFLKPYLKESGIRYKLIKYRPMGVRAVYRETLAVPADAEMRRLQNIAEAEGMKDIVII